MESKEKRGDIADEGDKSVRIIGRAGWVESSQVKKINLFSIISINF